jgi:hypothetical protein
MRIEDRMNDLLAEDRREGMMLKDEDEKVD